MLRSLLYCCLIFSVLANTSAFSGSDSAQNAPDGKTATDITDAWLRFHESELCRTMDAVFTFADGGMQVRSLAEDDKNFEKMEALFQPLRNAHLIDIQRTPVPEKAEESEEAKTDPPPSLSQNYELRLFLGDPQLRNLQNLDAEDLSRMSLPPADGILNQRLRVYADQVLELNREIGRYAAHVPDLTRVAVDPEVSPSVRQRANAICRAHLAGMGRRMSKLSKSLEPAFPRASRSRSEHQPDRHPDKTPVEQAELFRENALAVTKRVDQFIRPSHFSVGLDELRQSSLLDQLRQLQELDSQFQKLLTKTK